MTKDTLELHCCPNCFRFASLSQTYVDENRSEIIRIYECQCGERFGYDDRGEPKHWDAASSHVDDAPRRKRDAMPAKAVSSS